MSKSVWARAAESSADPKRVGEFGVQFALATGRMLEHMEPRLAAVLAAVFAGSKALGEELLAHLEWAQALQPEALSFERRLQGLSSDVARTVQANNDFGTALRLFKCCEMLRIAARDLNRFADVSVLIQELSDLADVCLGAVLEVCERELRGRFGVPFVQDLGSGEWVEAKFCVLGMGKLGGQELNYSSDIDLLFVYSGEGYTFKGKPTKSGKGKGIPNSQFFSKLAEAIINECTRMTSEGFLYRVDMRLRPEGKTSPLARSLASYENYYAQYGQTWERMMLIKARCVAGDQALGAEFMEMIQPFRYPRSISEQIPREVAEMKARIENEVVRAGELERNVKLGRGGIREVEFLVQTLQVLHAGRNPFLQSHQTLPTIDKLADYHLITREEAKQLKEAYCFLRNVEHRLQMENNQQTHTIPTHHEGRLRLAKLMNFETIEAFEKQLEAHKENVRRAYEKVISPEVNAAELSLPREVEVHTAAWKAILEGHSFRDPERCVKLVKEFVQGPDFGHRSSRTVEHSIQLLRFMLKMCPRPGEARPPEPFLSDPDRVLARLDAFIARYGAPAMLYDAWVSNQSLFRLLLMAFDRSEHLAELAIREPDLIDEIEQSGQLRRRKTAEQILEDLRHGAGDEDQHRWLRRYFQAEQMRIGLRDILDLASPEQTQGEITALADAYLTYALEVVLRKNKLKSAPFAIFGLGKLGGAELIYASDLDIIFVADDKTKNLPAVQKLAVQLMDFLSKRTEDGMTFATDARLRPDGDKGLLVNTLSSYSDYYAKRAMLWEIQSLSRFRPIAGDPGVQEAFATMALAATDFSSNPPISAFMPDWKAEIHRMRQRIEKERTHAEENTLAIKTGSGGLMDVEFIAQALCLEHGWHEPNTLSAIARAAAEKAITEDSARVLSENYRKLMEVERILRRWSFEPESVLPTEAAPYYRVAVRCGFKQSAEFEAAVAAYRGAIRREYEAFFEIRNSKSEVRKKSEARSPKRKRS